MKEALRSSHDDEAEFHREAIERLHQSYARLQARLDAMYVDKLDGKVSESFYEVKVAEWCTEQDRVEKQLVAHKVADRSYLDHGIALLELASKAKFLYEKQSAPQKRRDGLRVEFRQPFDILASTNSAHREQQAAGAASSDFRPVWLPALDSNSM